MADDFEPDEILPATDPDDPDDLLAAAEQLEGEEDDIEVETELPPIGRSWAFDFTQGQFVRNGQAPAEVRGDTALIVWIEKCLRTYRGASVVHPLDYGIAMPLEEYLGEEPDDTTELETDIAEALTAHPHIAGIEDFEVEEGETLDGDGAMALSFSVTLADGDDFDFEIEVDTDG